MPKLKGNTVTVSVYFDANNAHDLDIRRSVHDIILFLNNNSVQSYYNSQGTVESYISMDQILLQV